ncbi:MAG: riboflavin biosynthesis protein RibF [Eggerthellaceae bacterium]|nr:riboflavin biosynthesis protein RibF [Eggerthellaceae bacterium]
MAEIRFMNYMFDNALFAGSSCAFGVFDGVHRGHQFLIGEAIKSAQASRNKSIALTFDIDPDEKFHPDRLQKLMTNEGRLDSLATSGVDAVVVLPFTDALAAYAPQEFLEKTFNGFIPESLHVGSDFRFGARARGTVKELESWGAQHEVCIYAHELEGSDGAPITSTRIRELLGDTAIEKANELLGHPYSFSGKVIPGRGDGVDFGFRTANLVIDAAIQTLGDGVYAAYALCGGVRYKAAVSVGVSPTFADATKATCEVHILDFEGDLYGAELKLEFMHFLRPMMCFDSTEELIATVLANIEWVRTNL